MDVRAAMARDFHRAAARLDELANRDRVQRDMLIRALRAEDPKQWTHAALATAVGCSPELIAYICKGLRTSA